MELKSSGTITRYSGNPVLKAADLKYPSNLVFNAGVAKLDGNYVMIFRNDYGHQGGGRFEGTNLGIAFSEDGLHWNPSEKPFFTMDQMNQQEIRRIYDPRLTVIDGQCYLCFAADTCHGTRGGIARMQGLDSFEIVSMSVPDNRNMVLFPEKIGGCFVRLERPFPVYSRGGDRFDIWLSKSPDLVYWGESQLVLAVEDVPFCNEKIGPGAPPVKTKDGWLTLFHSVYVDPGLGKNGWEDTWKKRYSAGIMLLDLSDPSKVIGISKEPLIAPEAPYETQDGFRNHVIFPGGMILEDSGEVKIYYGAADTVECLATAHVEELVQLCK